MGNIDSVLGSLAYESENEKSSKTSPAKRCKYLTPSPSPTKGSESKIRASGSLYGLVTAKTKHYNHLPATPQSLLKPSGAEASPHNRDPQKELCTGPRPSATEGGRPILGQIDKLPRPQLVFRFYNQNSSGVNGPTGMRAGLFQNSREKLPPPPDIDSEAFRKEAAKHFSWIREPTPFISTYESILPVLHRGLLSSMDASIAVIDLHTVSRSQRRDQSKVYVAAHLIQRLGLRQEAHGYRAISEWLVWGMIHEEAIVATFKIKDLRTFLAGSPDVRNVLRFPEIENSRNANEYREKLEGNFNQVGRASGRVVGKFLNFIALPEFYIQKAASKISRDWHLGGNKSIPRLRSYLGGVQLGLQQAKKDIRTSTQAKAKLRLTKYLKQVGSGFLRKGADDMPPERAKPRPCLVTFMKQMESGLQRKEADDVPSKHSQPKPQMTSYLRQVNSGLQRNGVGAMLLPQTRQKRHLADYLQQVDSGLGRKRAEIKPPGRRKPRPRLASYLERLDLRLGHAEEVVTEKHGVSVQDQESDGFCSRRRCIEAVCSG